jgi:hypothetical protein
MNRWYKAKLKRVRKHKRCKNCKHYRPTGNYSALFPQIEIEHCDRDVDANGNGGERRIPFLRRCKHFQLYQPSDRYRFEGFTAYAERLQGDKRYQRILREGIYREYERL